MKITDLYSLAELDHLVNRAARIAGAGLWIRDESGGLIVESDGAEPRDSAREAKILYKETVLGTVDGGDESPALGEVLEWLTEGICERASARDEIDGLANHITENYEELNGLFDVIRHLPSLTSLDIVRNCEALLGATRRLVVSERSWMLIAQDDQDELTLLEKRKDGRFLRSAYDLDAGNKGVWEHSFESGDTVNAAIAEDLPQGVRLRQDLGIDLPLICLRLEADETPLGVLCFCGKPGSDFFTSTEVKLATTIAAYAGSLLSNARLYERVRTLFLGAISALAAAIESKDDYTHGHVERVTEFSSAIAEEMGFDSAHVEHIRLAAMMHDLGKIGVPDSILGKKGKLTEEEQEVMRSHALIGPKIIEGIKPLEAIVPWIRGHHERPDGKGYPLHLQGEEIPVEALILSVADAFDAMTSDRPYRKAVAPETAAQRLREGSGTQFGERAVEAFLRTPTFEALAEGQ